MFRQLAVRLQPNSGVNAPLDLFNRHPLELVAYMERVWEMNHPATGFEAALPTSRFPLRAGDTIQPFPTPHLSYAYMVGNTRIYEVFRRVLYEYRHGEKLGTPQNLATQNWLRNTEELFYSDPAPFTIGNVSSHVRSDLRATHRNAQYRMFGWDFNHGGDDGKPYPYAKAEAANSDFVSTFEEFLREVWVGITYVTASSSSNPTDDSKLAVLAENLHNMLRSRRVGGNINREEFFFVAMMSWFHLSLEAPGSPIVASLRAEAVGVENILFRVAERVGLPAHGLSRSFFEVADPISRLLIQMELGTYNSASAVRALYDNTIVNSPEPDLRTIITHWTAITGRDVKARKVASS